MSVQPIIQLDDIKVHFRSRTGPLLHPNIVKAVDGVSLTLMPGETIGIVGESGCGKSTTANVMCGLQKPTSGTVYFRGEDVTKRTAANRKKMGRVVSVVFQDPSTALNARMVVRDQLKDPLNVHNVGDKEGRDAEVEELISLVGLPHSALDALPGQLSGGQRQRVAIARAMIIEPDLVVLDEAVSALDVTVQAQILRLLDELQRELELTYIFISHDLAVVNQISDTVSVLSHGTQVESGPTAQVFAHPETEYTRQLIDAIPGSRYRAGDLNLGL